MLGDSFAPQTHVTCSEKGVADLFPDLPRQIQGFLATSPGKDVEVGQKGMPARGWVRNLLAAPYQSGTSTDVLGQVRSPGEQVGANVVGVKDALARGWEVCWNENHDAGILRTIPVRLR